MLNNLLQIGGSFLQQRQSAKNTAEAQKRNYQYGEMAAHNAHERAVDFWNMQNEYNTYSADIQRMRDAGLSPGLAYGNGVAGGSNAEGLSSVPQNMSAGTGVPAQANNLASGLTQAAAIREINSRTDLNESQAEKNRADTGKVTYEEQLLQSQAELNALYGENTKLKSYGQELDNSLTEDMYNFTVEQARQVVDLNRERLSYYIEQAEMAAIEVDFARASFDTRLEILQNDCKLKAAGVILQQVQAVAASRGIVLTEAQIDDLRQRISWYPKEVESRIGLQSAISSAQSSQSNLSDKNVDWFDVNQVFNLMDRTVNTLIRGLSAGASAAASAF